MAQSSRNDLGQTLLESLPAELPILPLRNTVALPHIVLPLLVGTPRSVRLIEDAAGERRLIGMVTVKEDVEDPLPGQLYEVGTIGLIHRVARDDDGNLQVIVQGLERFSIEAWGGVDPYLRARVQLRPDEVDESLEAEALQRSLVQAAQAVLALLPNVPAEMGQFLDHIQEPTQLVYMIASNSRLELPAVQALLEAATVNEKMRTLIAHLSHEREVLSLTQKIAENAHEEMGKEQREYVLRQQLEAIRRELGEADEQTAEADDLRKKIEEAALPVEAHEQALRELGRLENMPPQAAEYSVIKTYLDWLVELPWHNRSRHCPKRQPPP